MQVATVELCYSEPPNCGHLTTDSRSDKENSKKESHFEGITIDRKRKRTTGNAAVYNVRITVRCASSYSEMYYAILNLCYRFYVR